MVSRRDKFTDTRASAELLRFRTEELAATALPGFVEVRAVSQGASPAPVFSVLLWSFSLEGDNDYVA